eukprot:jgi/Mesen1/5134/ME000255S04110
MAALLESCVLRSCVVAHKSCEKHTDALQSRFFGARTERCLLQASMPTARRSSASNHIVAYLEKKDGPLGAFFGKLQGGLPIVGLLSRLLTDEGGVGGDRLRYAEFCTRVQKNLTGDSARALTNFSARNGKPAKSAQLFFMCWIAAVGAGLVKSEQLMLSARRLRVSGDMEYELETFDQLLEEAWKRKSKTIDVPIELRCQKALEAVCTCCLGTLQVSNQEDAADLTSIMGAVFPSVQKEFLAEVIAQLQQPADDTPTLDSDSLGAVQS